MTPLMYIVLGVLIGWQAGCHFGAWAARNGYVIGARPDPTYTKENAEETLHGTD